LGKANHLTIPVVGADCIWFTVWFRDDFEEESMPGKWGAEKSEVIKKSEEKRYSPSLEANGFRSGPCIRTKENIN